MAWTELQDVEHSPGRPLLPSWLVGLRDNERGNAEKLLPVSAGTTGAAQSVRPTVGEWQTVYTRPVFIPRGASECLNVLGVVWMRSGSGRGRAKIGANEGTEVEAVDTAVGDSTAVEVVGYSAVELDPDWRGTMVTLQWQAALDDDPVPTPGPNQTRVKFFTPADNDGEYPDCSNGSWFGAT